MPFERMTGGADIGRARLTLAPLLAVPDYDDRATAMMVIGFAMFVVFANAATRMLRPRTVPTGARPEAAKQ